MTAPEATGPRLECSVGPAGVPVGDQTVVLRAILDEFICVLDEHDVRLDADSPAVTRTRILDAAIQIFAIRGFGSTTMRDIAAAVGIKAPGLYAHFDSKEQILSLAMLRALAGFLVDIAHPIADTAPVVVLETTVRRHVLYQLRHPQITRANDLLMANDVLGEFLPPSQYDRVRRAQRAYFELLRRRVAGVQPVGAPVDPTVATFAVINLCDLVTSWYEQGGPLRDEDVANQYWQLVKGMLRLPAEREPSLATSEAKRSHCKD